MSWEDKVNDFGNDLYFKGMHVNDAIDKGLDLYNEMKKEDPWDLEYEPSKSEAKGLLMAILNMIADLLNNNK